MYAAAPQGTFRLPPSSRNPGGAPPPRYHPVSVIPLTPPTPPRQEQRGQYTFWRPQIPTSAPAPQPPHIPYPPGHHVTRHTQPSRQPRSTHAQVHPSNTYPRSRSSPHASPFWKQGRNIPSSNTSTPATTMSYLTQESVPVTVPPRPQPVPIQTPQKKQPPPPPPVQGRPTRSRSFSRRHRETTSSMASEVIIPPLLPPSAVPVVIPVNDRQARKIRKAMPTAGVAGLGAGRSRTALPISEKPPVPTRRPTLRRSNSSVHFTPGALPLSSFFLSFGELIFRP